MDKSTFHILFCDDDASFAASLTETLARKLSVRFKLKKNDIDFTLVTNLNDLRLIATDTKKMKVYDLVFCDLGWAGLTLAGVQILHDMQLAHPDIHTVLYTAQDENSVVAQALSWQLDFIDTIIRIDGIGHFEKMLTVIHDCFKKQTENTSPYTNEKFKELIENHFQFPRIDDSALLALDKARYFSFIKEKYGSFPQMAKERRLDLNNIYRANRRFKNSQFVAFQYGTIREIVGVVDLKESEKIISEMMAKLERN